MKIQQSRDWELVNLGDVTCHKNSITLGAEKKLVQSMFANPTLPPFLFASQSPSPSWAVVSLFVSRPTTALSRRRDPASQARIPPRFCLHFLARPRPTRFFHGNSILKWRPPLVSLVGTLGLDKKAFGCLLSFISITYDRQLDFRLCYTGFISSFVCSLKPLCQVCDISSLYSILHAISNTG